VNNTFYRLPSERTIAAWAATVPDGFTFAIKASRYITHMKKLKDPRESAARFLNRIAAFGHRLGPVLFQLPPGWSVNVERLASFLEALPVGNRYAFEFRDASWHIDEVYSLLREHGAAFCIYDLAGKTSPLEVTADLVYVRLHGPGDAYRGSYTTRALSTWARAFEEWSNERDVWCYFDNDERGYAPKNALSLRSMIG
jgi:uncharacterized protein YecE (DUF72 family)